MTRSPDMPPELLFCCRGFDFVVIEVGLAVGGCTGGCDGGGIGGAVGIGAGVGRFEGVGIGDFGDVPGAAFVDWEGWGSEPGSPGGSCVGRLIGAGIEDLDGRSTPETPMTSRKRVSPESLSFEMNSSRPTSVMNGNVTKVSNGKFPPSCGKK